MKKSILLAFFACFSACAARAEMVTPAMAMAAADAWAERNAQFDTGNNATNVITEHDANVTNIVLWHQVSMDGGGCLIIAPVTEIEPVVMALERDPGELPEAHPLRDILTLDMRGRLRFLNLYPENAPSSGGRLRLTAAAPSKPEDEEKAAHREAVRQEWAAQQQSKWNRLRAPRRHVKSRLGVGVTQQADDSQMKVKIVLPGFESGGKLTHWNQDGDYATYTPDNVVCGCVATAAAAIMQYFRAGEKDGQEIKSGQKDAGTTYKGSAYPSSTKGGKYDWANPTGELYGRVTYDAGVAVGMGWNVGGSGASEMATAKALVEYFGFAEARYVNNPRPDQYEKLIYAQCRSGAPVGMGISKSGGGSGHSVVAVGYGIDEDDVERVRVFLGWGGSGDGWYALPYINTKSTLYGEEDLYDILDGIITMIGYENDNVVPVYGRLLPYINPPMTIGGVEYSHEKDGDYFDNIFIDGFFGARVSASGTQTDRQVKLECVGKSGSVTIGPAASKTEKTYVSDGDAICKWVPDPIFFPLLNSEVALSFADAREKCIASFETETNKAVFAFSGDWDEQATNAAWDYLYWLDTEADDATKEAFTNKYIVLCVPYSLGLSSESDGKPSIGVFDGRAISDEENKMWSFYNGRLSYWSIGSATYTNDVDAAEFPYTNVVETVDSLFVSYSYTNVIDGVSGEGIEYVTGELVTNAMIRVMEMGLTNFYERASGISLTIEAAGFTNIVSELSGEVTGIGVSGKYEGSGIPGHADPDYGLYENKYTNGTTIAISAPAFATNAAGNVELACRGYLLSSTNTPEVVTNLEATALTLTPIRNGAYTVTWLWETNAVKITRELAYGTGAGTITSDKGDNDWYKVGEVVTFTATGAQGSMTSINTFNSWVIDGAFWEDDAYSESGNMLVMKATHPANIRASFDKGSTINAGSFNLTVKNYGAKDGDPVPETLVGGAGLPYDTVTNLSRVSTDVLLVTNAYTDVDGVEQTCLGWQLIDGDGTLRCAMYDLGVVAVPINFVKASQPGNLLEGDGGGLAIYGNDIVDPMTGKIIKDEEGFRLYEKSETSPLSWVGVNPNIYGITNGASATLVWLWKLPEPPPEDPTNMFEIVWNDALNNLFDGYTTNLLSAAEMAALSLGPDDISISAPTGWVATVSTNAEGNAVATLARDEAALSAAMDTCTLTIFPTGDGSGTYTVQADILEALRGFWYVLYGSDDLATWEAVASGTYESGTPAAQGQGTAEAPLAPVTLLIVVTPGDTAAGVKRFYKVVSGATQDPLAETAP